MRVSVVVGMLPLPGLVRESAALRPDDYEAIWQADRAASRQRRATAAEKASTQQRASRAAALSKGGVVLDVQLPSLMRSTRVDMQPAADALVAELESGLAAFADLEAALKEERATKLKRAKQAMAAERSAASKILKQSATDTALFFTEHRRAGRRGDRLPPLGAGTSPSPGDVSPSQAKGQRFGLREQASDRRGFGGRLRLEHSGGAPSPEAQLLRLLQRHLLRLIDLFRRWDVDDSGDVDPDEFFEAICALGYDVPRTVSDALFESLDSDGGGTISYQELKVALQAARARADKPTERSRPQPHESEPWPHQDRPQSEKEPQTASTSLPALPVPRAAGQRHQSAARNSPGHSRARAGEGVVPKRRVDESVFSQTFPELY